MSLANNLRLRRSVLKLSQKGLAEKAGVSQQLIHALEAGTTRSSKFIDNIAKALDCAVTELDPGFGLPAAVRVQETPNRAATLPRELPVFAADTPFDAAAPNPEEAIDFISRPFSLQNMRRAYGLMLLNNTMHPEFDAGDYVLVNPYLPPLADTSCVFFAEAEDGGRLMVARLLSVADAGWNVRLWNPDGHEKAEQMLLREQWPLCHRIVARHCRK
jgi:transcriptional regulator with XRE-family HTH domain